MATGREKSTNIQLTIDVDDSIRSMKTQFFYFTRPKYRTNVLSSNVHFA